MDAHGKRGRLGDDDDMIPMVGGEADIIPVLVGVGGGGGGEGGGGGGGGKGGGGKGGGGTDLTLVMMEEQVKEMQRTINAMKQEMDTLRKENETLKNNSLQHPDQGHKETWGRWDQGWWRDGGRWDDDPWKNWKGRNETMKKDNKYGAGDDDDDVGWDYDDRKGDGNFEYKGGDAEATVTRE